MWTIDEVIAEAAGVLGGAGVGEARREAGSLLAHVINRDRAFLITHGDEALLPDALSRFRQAVARRAAGEPFQYIVGRQEFYGLDFEVTPDVLIPRPETELLVETALKLLRETPVPRICDVGTGSGCVAVTLLHELTDARGVALDISPAALEVAARNAARHRVGERLSLLHSDCFAALDPAGERFAAIVSNPPYVAESHLNGLQREVRDHEPRVALTPGGDGLKVIRCLLHDAPQFLVAGGHLVFEIGFDQHEAVGALIDPRVWTLLDIHEDLQGIPRIVALRKGKGEKGKGKRGRGKGEGVKGKGLKDESGSMTRRVGDTETRRTSLSSPRPRVSVSPRLLNPSGAVVADAQALRHFFS